MSAYSIRVYRTGLSLFLATTTVASWLCRTKLRPSGLSAETRCSRSRKSSTAAVFTFYRGNHRLYGDISNRVMTTIASVTGDVCVYSIDEAFIDMGAFPFEKLQAVGREIVRKVRRDIGVPTSLGIANTMTLAKMASRFAKKYSAYRGVCIIDNEYRRRRALELTPIGDVWGIGRRLVRRFSAYGIATAADFANMDEEDVKKIVNITGWRTWRELNGAPR